MAIHSQDLLENAADSFNEALQKYREAVAGNNRAYKFAILHYAHFLELLFKHYVSESHSLLIYKNPFSKKIENEQTIGLWEAVQFLKNEGREIDPDFIKDLEWIKRLRNDIEHHRFSMDINEVRLTIGRLTQALTSFHSEYGSFDLEEIVGTPNLDVFNELADEYKAAIARARVQANEESEDDEGHFCPHCGNDGTAAYIERNTAEYRERQYECKYCGEIDALTECCICGETIRESEGELWNDEHPPLIDYICYGCSERIRYM